MTTTGFILAPDEWQRLLELAIELPGVRYDGNIKRLGIRLINVLRGEGWTQFLSTDYERARAVIEKHYAEKAQESGLTEEQAFEIGAQKVWYSAAILIDMARTAYEHRHNDAAMRGLSKAYGRSAKHMARAVEYWGADWFAAESPRAQTAQECLILFALASLPEEQAHAGYNHWLDHSDLTYFDMLEYVQEAKAQVRLKDFGRYPYYKRTVVRGTDGMKKTGDANKQSSIKKIEEILEKEL